MVGQSITKLDLFAAAALTGLLASGRNDTTSRGPVGSIVDVAYTYARVMENKSRVENPKGGTETY